MKTFTCCNYIQFFVKFLVNIMTYIGPNWFVTFWHLYENQTTH